ncbi:hypothetical protein F5H01DRAFT_261036, partial [Linnemannia elongata]
MKLLSVICVILSLTYLVAADVTCSHNNDCTSTWVGYNCECANARRMFIQGMASEGINCWVGPGFGVGCANDCGGKCDCGRNHHWEGS